ncbi:MAG: pilus assembly protein N-terminal domain-containing protein [Rhizobiales bacterium]|nr:pilus assembly protein N-terminal domain-containing protein [Hyphomicrobiales bacterium]
MFRRLCLSMLAVAALTASTSTGLLAATEIVVMADEAKLVSVGGEISTVVVGNPAIADATVQGQNVFIHGRSYGSTNLIVLDKEGSQIANLGITVMQGGNSNLTVFRAGGKYSYVCEPQCQVALQIGDKQDFFDAVNDETTKKIGLATGLTK